MSKNVEQGSLGRDKVRAGIDIAANAVKVTLGAAGKTVIIGEQMGLPQYTKDGVTVAKRISLPGVQENIGVTMVKEVAGKTVDMAGDGTSTATVLFQAIVDEGTKLMTAGVSPIDLKSGMNKATQAVTAHIKLLAKSVDDEATLRQIAAISANNNEEIGNPIADTYWKLGVDGILTIEESLNHETSVSITKGMKIVGRGYMTPEFVTNKKRMIAELENPLILLFERTLMNLHDVIPVMEHCIQAKRPLLVMADSVEGEVYATMVLNNMKGTLQSCCIRCPEFGTLRAQLMEDICVYTGGSYITEASGYKPAATLLGSAEKVVVDKNSTVIFGKQPQENIEAHVEHLKGQMADASEHEKHNLKTRVARLSGSVGVFKVGGATESEMKEKKDRVDDAIRATHAALEEGFVAGGGTTYLACLEAIKTTRYNNDDERKGAEIIAAAIKKPFVQILENGDVKEPQEEMSHIISSGYGTGLNMRTGKKANLFEAGIIDPAKVLRVALENATSIGILFLTTECVISDIKND